MVAAALAPRFAAVDWGTTRLRVWLVAGDGTVLAERRSDDGLLSVAKGGFGAVLERILSDLGAPEELPAVACGMVGARQGWVEAPYVLAPASLDAVLFRAVRAPGTSRPVLIVPGVAQKNRDRPDVMRGEETQLAGVARLRSGAATVCMPGTHSKWVAMRDGTLTSFSTWMTGELFSVIAGHSILRHSLGEPAPTVNPSSTVFADWLRYGLDKPGDLTARLFGIRAGGLLFDMPKEDGAAALSGLLIGAEIAAARRAFGSGEIVLVASGALADLYAAALNIAGVAYTHADADEAVRAGLIAAAGKLLPVPA